MRYLSSRFVKVGLILFVFGSGPLIIYMTAAALGLTDDPKPNPVGLGIMAMFTFWPSIILIAVGVIRTRMSMQSK